MVSTCVLIKKRVASGVYVQGTRKGRRRVEHGHVAAEMGNW
jgi:hypothetical protein